jgi:integrase
VVLCAEMSIRKDHKARLEEGLEVEVLPQNATHTATQHHEISGKQVANTRQGKGKNSAPYWQERIFKPVNARGEQSPHYSMKVAYKGRRMAFTTGTGNQKAAAASAAGIYLDLLSLGVEATLAKHRPQKAAKGDKVATVGQWIEGAREVSEAGETTFTCYARALRLIAGGVAELKKNKKRFGPKKGGSTVYRDAIDAISLEALDPVAIQRWRLAYVKKAKNPAKESSAKTSCNSTIRQARSLFAEKVVRFLPLLRLPDPAPFAKVEFYDRQHTKYVSKIDAPAIVEAAHTQLSKTDPQAFLSFLLAIGAGLRRGEIDTLCWHQIDFKRCQIEVATTEVASVKTDDSRGEIEIDERTATLLQGFRALAKGKDKDFVIVAEGGEGKRKWGQHYRADIPFKNLITWLRGYKQDGKQPLQKVQKPIHELRKELGALITQEHGIYAASRALRHSNVGTTAAYYADKKARTTVSIGSFINPKNVVEMLAVAPDPAPQKVNKSEYPKRKASR